MKWWTLNRLSLGNCRGEEITEAKEFFTQLFSGDEEVSDKEIIRQLWGLYKSESPEKPLAEKCLRCVISHYIKIQCFDLAKKYGSKHDFTVEDLFPFVLDCTDSSLNNGNHNSLTARILQSFKLEQASLSTWTKRIVITDRELKIFLLEHGIELVTNWLLLKQYNSRKLRQNLSELPRFSSTEIQQYTRLLESYQNVYLAEIQAARNQINQEREQQGLRKITTPYPAPNHQQLVSMAEELSPIWKLSPEEVLKELQNLAQFIRDYKSSRYHDAAKQSQTKSNIYDNNQQTSEISNVYRQLLQDCLIAAIKEVTEERVNYLQSKRKKRDKPFLQGLDFFHCQYVPMTEIAEKIGLNNQSQVSRLLDQTAFRSDISRRTLVKLRSKLLEQAQIHNSPSQLKNLELEINTFVDEEVSNVMQEAEKEASISKNRVMRNLLSIAICQYLDTRK
ncbi:MAG: hypothetical protein SAK29_42500 [Scytonema sp. PMC 1069.18]|nr:hypothetical protein [Scytonema sp. PMC 1069.18]MEC4888302.1 hypothetical protein [Scytonema sp. PMC 1070.18]